MEQKVLNVRLDIIKVGNRARKDLGDLDLLADSIAALGLLQPIGIDPNYRLVFGERRLRAVKKLGHETILARIIHVQSLIAAEHAENEIRKDFTHSERVAIGAAIESELGNRRGQRTDLKSEEQGDLLDNELRRNLDDVHGKRTDQIAAEKAGFGNKDTYRQAKTVTRQAEPELIDAMDRETIAISTAAKLAKASPEVQRQAAQQPQLAVSLAKAAAAKAKEAKQAVTDAANAKRDAKRDAIVEKLEATAQREVCQPTGLFDVVVIDPPWPMQKIERDERPNQVAFDYPTMTEAELIELKIPADDSAHVWLWTTHKFMPMALRLLEAWGLKYVCTFVWHKPGGFQPIGLPQYNSEFALYARKGNPAFIDTKAFPTCFQAPRGAHSEKPEEFYEVLRRVTAGRRLDMFNRRQIDGFSGWGQEAVQ